MVDGPFLWKQTIISVKNDLSNNLIARKRVIGSCELFRTKTRERERERERETEREREEKQRERIRRRCGRMACLTRAWGFEWCLRPWPGKSATPGERQAELNRGVWVLQTTGDWNFSSGRTDSLRTEDAAFVQHSSIERSIVLEWNGTAAVVRQSRRDWLYKVNAHGADHWDVNNVWWKALGSHVPEWKWKGKGIFQWLSWALLLLAVPARGCVWAAYGRRCLFLLNKPRV